MGQGGCLGFDHRLVDQPRHLAIDLFHLGGGDDAGFADPRLEGLYAALLARMSSSSPLAR